MQTVAGASSMVTKLRQRDTTAAHTTVHCCAVNRAGNALPTTAAVQHYCCYSTTYYYIPGTILLVYYEYGMYREIAVTVVAVRCCTPKMWCTLSDGKPNNNICTHSIHDLLLLKSCTTRPCWQIEGRRQGAERDKQTDQQQQQATTINVHTKDDFWGFFFFTLNSRVDLAV